MHYNFYILSARTGPYHLSRLFVRVSKYSSNFVAGVYSWRDISRWEADCERVPCYDLLTYLPHPKPCFALWSCARFTVI